ncbi:DUF1844 domain-containing protein [Fimbriimonas ginsengisoli]|uniref:DUF1844 domain-containing protein n=1 Tax=Fimbriimonas ginsengisoli Gsoil 348 TaxID=661478 RepID=A0A068NIP1_FIMGI|nr:DUF1844 domain-containing protein [Fimbriimonas ginsengisoli]AIE83468.1 hypothetical protein OP10G_0100 [Fimbriimonas ginsengisoli Gsoil 348]
MADQDSNLPQKAPSVYDHIAMMIQQMAHVCWAKLGLQPDTITGKLEQNLEEAKVAIDVVASLVRVLEPQLDEEDRRQLQGMLRDLRLNFVQKSTEASS